MAILKDMLVFGTHFIILLKMFSPVQCEVGADFQCECDCIHDICAADRPMCTGKCTQQMQPVSPKIGEKVTFDEDDVLDACQEIDFPTILSCVESRNCMQQIPMECRQQLNRKCFYDGLSCYRPRAQNCNCSDDSQNDLDDSKTNNYLAIGVGIGVGACLLLAALIGLLVYCRMQGRKEGRKQAKSNITVNNRQDDPEEYAEIDGYVGERTMKAAAANPGYILSTEATGNPYQPNQEYTALNKPSNPAINSEYKSLKIPSQDMGTADYADPEKYTEPPNLPGRNFQVDDGEDTDEDYVSQGTPEPNTDNDRDYFTLEPPKPSDDYVDDTDKKVNSDYVDVDAPSITEDAKDESAAVSNDYVDVDAPRITEDGKDNSATVSNDYVDVDAKE